MNLNIVKEYSPSVNLLTLKLMGHNVYVFDKNKPLNYELVESDKVLIHESDFLMYGLHIRIPSTMCVEVCSQNIKYTDNQVFYICAILRRDLQNQSIVTIECKSKIEYDKYTKNIEKAEKDKNQNIIDQLLNNTGLYSPLCQIDYNNGIEDIIPLFSIQKFPKISFGNIFPKKLDDQLNQQDYLNLLPSDFLLLDDKTLLSSKSKGRISKYWNAHDSAQSDYEVVKDNILNLASSGNYSFFNLSEIEEIKNNLVIYLKNLSASVRQAYEDYITTLINYFLLGIKKESNIYKRFQGLYMKEVFENDLSDFQSKLTCLILIASTWLHWERASLNGLDYDIKSVNSLSHIIIPYRRSYDTRDIDNDIFEKQINEIAEKEKKYATDLLHNAIEFYNSHDYEKCVEMCRKIISTGYVEPSERGYAYYLLVKCREDFNCKYEGFYDAPKFMRKAMELGCDKACDEWNTLHMDSLLYCPKHSLNPKEHLIINTSRENKRIIALLKSLPEEMHSLDILKKYIIFANTKKDLIKAIDPFKRNRFILLDDDLNKNFQDFIFVLNHIKTYKIDNEHINDNPWSKTHIFLRTHEEEYASLIDTAIKHMDGLIIKIHLIDEEKWTAQHLLSTHPIFYPIRFISKHFLLEKKYLININIIANGNDNLTCWLIREAFWMSCFCYTGLEISINVFAPNAKKIEEILHYKCKGMFEEELPDSKETSSINIRFFELQKENKLIDLLEKNNQLKLYADIFDYFIINTKDDISNLNLGIRIREWSVTNSIKYGKKINKIELPIIAYYCEDPNIAHLSRSMVVQNESHGDSWYNNYNLIPFGLLTDRYSYDNLMGGYFENIALSTHYQYYGISTNILTSSDSKELELFSEAEDAYYSRCYNRDSSLAVALSIPYRLFQTVTSSGHDHIFPTGWNISNNDAFTDSAAIEEMAMAFLQHNNTDELQVYEHARWCRWILSRGWTKATPEMVIRYMDAGNIKHQLYIGKMHGCICSYEDQKNLSHKMYERHEQTGNKNYVTKTGQEIDFLSVDKKSIQHTAEIEPVKKSL